MDNILKAMNNLKISKKVDSDVDELSTLMQKMNVKQKKIFTNEVYQIADMFGDMSLNEIDDIIRRTHKMIRTQNIDDDIVYILHVLENKNLIEKNTSGMAKLEETLAKLKSVSLHKMFQQRSMRGRGKVKKIKKPIKNTKKPMKKTKKPMKKTKKKKPVKKK
jgi:hypothetical protein